MSVKAMTWAFAQEGLPPAEKLLLLALADHADDAGICWPGQALLSRKTSMSRKTIYRTTKSLKEKGLVQVEARKVMGTQRSNKYRLNLGLMLIPCVSMTPDHGSPCPITVYPHDPLETSIEPSVEPPMAQSAMDEYPNLHSLEVEEEITEALMKGFGEQSVEEALKATTGSKVKNPTDAIPGLKKQGQRYLTSALEHIFKVAYAHYGNGFLAENTMKQKGQFTKFQKKLQGIDAAQVICCTIKNWSRFMEKTDAYKPPKKPNIGFMLVHATHAGDLFVQSLAQKKHTHQPLFKKVKKSKNLTNESEKTDNDDEFIKMLEDITK